VDRRGVVWWKSKSDRALEIALAELFKDAGYETTLTKTSGDGGIDLIVKSSTSHYLIQSKGWQSRVGVTTVRELAGVVAHSRFSKPIGVILATGGFTPEAKRFAKDSDIKLWTPEDLTQIAKGLLHLT
jgi:HJR/Mrr/RecB family endonuclease